MNNTEKVNSRDNPEVSDKRLEDEESTAVTVSDSYYNDITDVSVYSSDKIEERYYELFDKDKPKSQAWSAASLALGILSIILGLLWGWGAFVIGISSVVLANVSRKNLGYFNSMSVVGLILGIFGVVFSLAVIILGIVMGA